MQDIDVDTKPGTEHETRHHHRKAVGRRPVTVTVTILDDTPPGQFELSSNDLKIKTVKHNGKDEQMLPFDNYQDGIYQDGFEVSFNIQDKTKGKKGYGFFVDGLQYPPALNALSAKVLDADGHCPSPGQQWPTFNPTSVDAKRQTLVVDNANNALQYFGFALYFSLDGETEPSLCYDPIGNNQNGSSLE